MTSSPTDRELPDARELVELVDGELSAEREEDVLAALVAHPELLDEIAAGEAALEYALGGLADGEARGTARVVASTPKPIRRWVAGSLATAAAVLLGVLVVRAGSPGIEHVERTARTERHVPPSGTPAVDALHAELDALAARLDRVGPAPETDEHELLALAALGGARARLAAGRERAARVRLEEVLRDFPKSSAARTARAELTLLEGE